jgi:gamma-glutamylcyclotransferase (GGCT)/AIG2-like uncharacterized protein YtfP
MEKTIPLFVYGTLRQGSVNRFARLLHDRARFLGVSRMQGRLYNLGRYPGAVPSNVPTDWVRGELFRLDQPAKILAALDAYEGPQFARVPQRVYLASGLQLAWVYLYQGNPTGTRIVSGAWPVRRA